MPSNLNAVALTGTGSTKHKVRKMVPVQKEWLPEGLKKQSPNFFTTLSMIQILNSTTFFMKTLIADGYS